ncbi:MAG: hypothetical protein ACR2GJ_09775 [Gemmatimonadaceae bacterium]
MILENDRFLDPDPTVRRIPRTLYEETRDLADMPVATEYTRNLQPLLIGGMGGSVLVHATPASRNAFRSNVSGL